MTAALTLLPAESAASDVNNARQVVHLLIEQLRSGEIALELDDLEALASVARRLDLAIAKIETEDRIARARLADAEVERRLIVDECRELQEALAGISAAPVALTTDYEAGLFRVERQYVRTYYEGKDWPKAAALYKELRAIDAALHPEPRMVPLNRFRSDLAAGAQR